MTLVCRRLALIGFVLTVSVLPAFADPVLYVSTASGTISRYTLSGVSLGALTTIGGQAAGLAVHDQTIYVADYYPGNVVRSFAADGTPLATFSHGTALYGTSGMAFDTSGNLFVSDQLDNTVRKVSSSGADLGVFASGLGSPWGLAFDAGGDLYVANRAASTITKYAADGTSLGVFASAGLSQPIGIAFDSLGNLFVANFGNSTIREFSSAGADLGVFASVGLSNPTEIAFDDDGNLYVANWANGTVRLYAANGSDLGNLVSGLPSPPQGIAISSRAAQSPLSVNGAPTTATYGTSFGVTATGGSGTGDVTFIATGACTNTAGSALITMTSGSGICSITATKAGDTDYKPTTSATVAATAQRASQTIVFAALPNRMLGDPPFTVDATGGLSGNPVTFLTTTSTVCTSAGTDGATITLAATGTCTVRASQGGNSNYDAADDVDRSFLVQGGTTFAGLFSPWAPPGPGTYNGVAFTSGTVFKMNSALPVKWGYSLNGILVDSSRSTSAQYPVMSIFGPLAACGEIDGTGGDTVVSYTGPGATVTTYDSTTKTWQRSVKLDSSFQGDKCYIIQVYDPVSNTTSPSFPFKTRK